MTELEMNSLIVRNPDLISTDMDGDTVMMSIESGEYYGINGVGSRIWELLDKPTTLSEITTIICSEFEVPDLVCQADAKLFIQTLIESGLVSLV